MPTEIIKSLNWIDIAVGLIIIRTIYSGIKTGVVTEIFKLLGSAFSVFAVLHYYSQWGEFLYEKIHLPLAAAQFVSFLLLWAAVMLIAKFVREGFLVLLRMEAHSLFDRWGGLVLSLSRGLLVASLFLLLLNVLEMDYLKKNLEKSLTAPRLALLAPKTYEFLFSGLVVKFFPNEEINSKALHLNDFSSTKNE